MLSGDLPPFAPGEVGRDLDDVAGARISSLFETNRGGVAEGGGTLAGIARRAAPRAPMETIGRAGVSTQFGIEGDHRGGLKPGGKRQITLMERGDWLAACAELGVDLPWEVRRANLLVDGLDLPQIAGARLRIGPVLLEISTECDPCQRMDEIVMGLDAALRPDWRGGACARVLEGGEVTVGNAVTVEY